ncbi:MAG: hypothetical protein ACTHNU_04475 [Gaiellales bacterium]
MSPTDSKDGKRRLAERDRSADTGERREEYESGQWSEPGDPAGRARSAAANENLGHEGARPPGTTRVADEWQREKQRTGRNPAEPGFPGAAEDDSSDHRRD